jgi:hypothetical protein
VNWGRNTGVDGTTNVANLDRVDQTLDRSAAPRPGRDPLRQLPGLRQSDAGGAALHPGDHPRHRRQRPEEPQRQHQRRAVRAPAGPVGFAAGVEVRKESGWRNPDNLTVLGIANTNRQDPIAGNYTAREVYAELAVPLLNKLPFVESLQFNTARATPTTACSAPRAPTRPAWTGR